MELYDVMRTTFAAREFTGDPFSNATLFKILENARFAPTGGNRQGGRVIVIRERKTREALATLAEPAAKRYAAQVKAGESPWNTIDPSTVDAEIIAQTETPVRLTAPLLQAAVVLVVCVDLKVVASMDQNLDRVGVISGASIYPFVWNILLAARHEGYGGTITTLAVAQEVLGGLRLECAVPRPLSRIACGSSAGSSRRVQCRDGTEGFLLRLGRVRVDLSRPGDAARLACRLLYTASCVPARRSRDELRERNRE